MIMAVNVDQKEKIVYLKEEDSHDEGNPCKELQGISKDKDDKGHSHYTSASPSDLLQPLSQDGVCEEQVESKGETLKSETNNRAHLEGKRSEVETNLEGQEKTRNTWQLEGVLSQVRDRWDAHIYWDGNRIWLGTFNSKNEAAQAYDRACIKLLGKDGTTNLPMEPILETVSAPFQVQFTRQEVAEMMEEHTYDEKLKRCKNANFIPKQVHGQMSGVENIFYVQNLEREVYKEQYSMMGMHHLFDKQLTVSDVGKLHRMVIPKRHAERYFPRDKLEEFLTFVDSDSRLEWQFRFSFWSSSKSYVLTRGWRRFVQHRDLKGGDMVSFSTDSNTPRVHKFYISVHCRENFTNNSLQNQSSSCSIPQPGGLSAVLKLVKLPFHSYGSEATQLLNAQNENIDVIMLDAAAKSLEHNSFHETTSSRGHLFRLFGVDISPAVENHEETDMKLKL